MIGAGAGVVGTGAGVLGGGVGTDGMREAPWQCVAAPLLTAAGCVLLFFYPDPFYRLLGLMFAGRG